MEAGSLDREPRDRCALAPIWMRTLLACHLQDTACVWQEKDFARDTRSHLPDGRRESRLGRTAYSRGALDARLRYLREDHLPLDAPSAQRSRASQTLARLSAKPSRSHCRHGFLYGPHDHFPCALLLFRHQPRPPTRAAFQRHTTSLQHLDRATVAGSFPRSIGSSISHLRHGCQVWLGGSDRGALDGHPSGSDLDPKSWAKWGCRAVGGELSA